jgi:rsbT co-antagonist protein RsbR
MTTGDPQQLRMYERLVALALDLAGVLDFDGKILFANPAWEDVLGYPPSDVEGRAVADFIHPEDLPEVEASAAKLVNAGGKAVRYESRWRHKNGSYRNLEWSVSAVFEERRTYAFARDITERRRDEALIRHQEASLLALSTPLIPISGKVLVMPLIGSVDTRRAEQVLETLLNGVSSRSANVVILDVTGVSMIDTQVADTLLRAARAVGLLGASVILTGVRPEVAQTLITLGVDLTGIITCGTLQSGIARANGL